VEGCQNIFPEICVAVLGMVAGLCTFANEKDVKKAKRTLWVIKDAREADLNKRKTPSQIRL
jgi:hypothetical protein